MKQKQQPIKNQQVRKRIKTQNTSARTSLKGSRQQFSQYKQHKNHRLPTVHKATKTQQIDKNNNQQKYGKIIDSRVCFKTKLQMINQQQSSELVKYRQYIRSKRNSLSIPYSKRLQFSKTQKIFDQLCQPVSSTPMPKTMSLHMSNIQIHQIPVQKIQKYIKVRQIYQQMKKTNKIKDVQHIINFINILRQFNTLYTKLDELLSIILIKKGRIHQFQQNCIIYNQNQLINSTLIVLWGNVKLKQIYRNKVKYCIPGDILCEQVILEQKKNKKYFGDIDKVKGSLIAYQTAKTQTKCGILQVNKESYEEIKNKFLQNGQKDKILIFQRILMWSLSKKAKLRK